MKNTFLKTTICVAAVVIGTSAFAGDHCHGPSSGVRLATDIVNLVGCSLDILRGPTVVYTEPAPVVYTTPCTTVYSTPCTTVYTTTPAYYCPPPPPPRPYYYRPYCRPYCRPAPPPPPRHHGPGPRHRR